MRQNPVVLGWFLRRSTSQRFGELGFMVVVVVVQDASGFEIWEWAFVSEVDARAWGFLVIA